MSALRQSSAAVQAQALAGSQRRLLGPFPDSASATPRLLLADFPPSAVDFHVSDIVEAVLAQRAAAQQPAALAASAEELKEAMWRLRSSVNARALLLPVQQEEEEGGLPVEPEPEGAADAAFRALEKDMDAWALRLLAGRLPSRL